MKRRAVFTAVVFVVMVATSQICCAGHSKVEVYPKGRTFVSAGKNLGEYLKADIWSATDKEVGLTIGPKIGPVSVGLGASSGRNSVDEVGISHTNFDLGFKVGLLGLLKSGWRGICWQSYSLYQRGHGEVRDFMLSRNWLSLVTSVEVDESGEETAEYFPVGIVSHTTRSFNQGTGKMETKSFWGLFVQLGEMGGFTSNRLGLAINVLDGKTLWSVWSIGF